MLVISSKATLIRLKKSKKKAHLSQIAMSLFDSRLIWILIWMNTQERWSSKSVRIWESVRSNKKRKFKRRPKSLNKQSILSNKLPWNTAVTTTVIVISLKLTKNIQTVIAVAGVSLEITYSIILDQNNELGKIELKKAITKVNSWTWQVAMNKFTRRI